MIYAKLVLYGEFLGIKFSQSEKAIPGQTGNFLIGLTIVVEFEDGTLKEYVHHLSYDVSQEPPFDNDELKDAGYLFDKFINENISVKSSETTSSEKEETEKEEYDEN